MMVELYLLLPRPAQLLGNLCIRTSQGTSGPLEHPSVEAFQGLCSMLKEASPFKFGAPEAYGGEEWKQG